MNHYTRMIGVMLILVYGLVAIFFMLDRVFTNIIYFQGMLYTQILGIPAILFLNVIVILSCIVMGSLVAYKQNDQFDLIKEEIKKIQHSEPLTPQSELYVQREVSEILALINKMNDTVQQIKYQNQLAINGGNEQLVKKIIEEERQRLARDLHDSVSQQLFAATMMLSAVKHQPLNESLNNQVNILEEMLNEAQQEMRALLLHLRPIQLQNKSFQNGINDLIIDLKKKVPMHIKTDIEQIQLSKGVEDHLFRITQEAISNTLRHAEASEMMIEFFKVKESIILRLVDNGKGFNMKERDESRYGLNTMKERALEIGGTCSIISAQGSGTKIEVKVPYNEEELNESIVRR